MLVAYSYRIFFTYPDLIQNDAGVGNGPGFPDMSGDEAFVISSESGFSKTRTGECNVQAGFICIKLYFSGCDVPFSPSQC